MDTTRLKNIIKGNKKKVVYRLDELYAIASELSSDDIGTLKNKKYQEFHRVVMELEREGFWRKYGNKKTSVTPPLYEKYRVITETIDFTDDENLTMIRLNKLNLTYYKNKVLEFREDIGILEILNGYLREVEKYRHLSINEISYILFGFEKAMSKTTTGKGFALKVMAKIGLNEESMGCRIKNEPLLNTIFNGFYTESVRNILIVENLETYWSLNKALREDGGCNIHMLIWGQGYSCVKNFAGVVQYGVSLQDNILYYGDLDLEGVYIYRKIKENFAEYNIEPYTSIYLELLQQGDMCGVKKSVSSEQKDISTADMSEFLNYFNKGIALKIETILRDRRYIPQEALNYLGIKDFLKRCKINGQ